MPVIVAEHAGYCMGVQRAVQAAEDAAKDGLPSCTLGDLIHNPGVVGRLADLGIERIDLPSQARGRRVIIRSHGISPSVLQQIRDASSEILDLTCPFVERLHRCVSDGTEDGKPVILIGEKTHPEVIGTAGWAHGDVYFVASREDAEKLPELEKALVVSQTTFSPEAWEEIVSVIRSKVREIISRKTICSATEIRQVEAEKLAERADAMIVVGGRNSANTRKLFEVCRKRCPRTVLVESAAEIPPAFADTHSELIGITAGASTPSDSLKEVVAFMNDIENQDRTTAAEETPAKNDFMAEVDATLKKIRPGQTVVGKVVQVNDEEVCVNIGYKADGVIKRADLVDQDAKVNDDIEVEVLKVNDGEGNVLLSQRNVISRKAWDELIARYEAGEYVTGVGKQEVKGGLIADISGIRAFVPASRLSQRFVGKISDFIGKELKLKIIEVDKAKRRIVASRKEVLTEESEARKKAAIERLEVGVIIHGIVRRLTAFGAFVDLGGVDGLIHITDLSWGHVKNPSEIVKPNQEIDVKILSIDPDKGRIQLGYKQLFPKPWDNASERYPEGSLVKGKVVRLTSFGAFVELEPGLDGLVHISQCSRTRISKVEDAVKIGDDVLVKILGIDNERKRISLSIRQALEEQEYDASEAAENAQEQSEASQNENSAETDAQEERFETNREAQVETAQEASDTEAASAE